MKKTKNFALLSVTVLTLTLLIATSSCTSEPKGERPDLPSAELLFMDYSDFLEQPSGAKGTLATYDNFMHALGTVLFWHSPQITVYTALPVAAYKVALAQEAEYLGDNTWEWSYEVPLGEQTYVVTLTASRMHNEEFSIEMDVALASMPNLGVRWFDGVVRYDHTYATWTIYKEGTVAVVEAVMNVDFEADNASLKYTYVEPDMEETNSYILYEWDAQEVLDASYTVSLSTGMTQIEWSINTKEGHVTDEVYFEDADWHCWDSLANGLVDKVCD
jgi:hypothetical protein